MPAVDPTEQFRLNAPDPGLFVEFDLHAVLDEEATAKEGRPIFRDEEYIHIIAPGDKNNRPHKRVTPELRAQYAQQYNLWKTGGDQSAGTGTPLSVWPGVTRSQVEELKYLKCRTVEQLANMADGMLPVGYIKTRQSARDWLESAAGRAPITALRKENEDLMARVAALEALVNKQDKALGKAADKKGLPQAAGA